MKKAIVIKWNRREKPARHNLRAMLQKEGVEPYEFVFPQNSHYGNHTHPTDEARIIAQGKMLMGIVEENKTRHILLEPGDKILIPKNTIHWAKAIGDVVCLCASKEN